MKPVFWLTVLLVGFLGLACRTSSSPSPLTAVFLLLALDSQSTRCESQKANFQTISRTETSQGVWETGFVSLVQKDAFVSLQRGDQVQYCFLLERNLPETSGTKIASFLGDVFVGISLSEPNPALVASSDALQKSYGRGSGAQIAFLRRVSFPPPTRPESATFLRGKNAQGITTSFQLTDLQVKSDRIEVTAIGGEDASSEDDSLDKTQPCRAGRMRVLEINYELSEVISSRCTQAN